MTRTNFRSASGRFVDWPAVDRELRRTPGEWRSIFPDAPILLARNIRQRRNPYLRAHPELQLEVDVQNVAPDEKGKLRGDVWLRLVVKKPLG